MTKEVYHALCLLQSVRLHHEQLALPPYACTCAGLSALNPTLTQTIAKAGELRIKIEGCGNAQAAQAASMAANMAAGPAAVPMQLQQLQQLQQLLCAQTAVGANPVNLLQLLSGQPAIAGNPAMLMQLLSGQPTMTPGNSADLLQQLSASLPAAAQANAPAIVSRLQIGSNPVRIRELPNTPRGNAQGEDANGLSAAAQCSFCPHIHARVCARMRA